MSQTQFAQPLTDDLFRHSFTSSTGASHRRDEWIDGLMDEWIDGLMDEWIDGLMDEWIDGLK